MKGDGTVENELRIHTNDIASAVYVHEVDIVEYCDATCP